MNASHLASNTTQRRSPGLRLALSLFLAATLLLAATFFFSACQRADPDTVLACSTFRQTLCDRVVQCGSLDHEQCDLTLFADAPSCTTVIGTEGDVAGCNTSLATFSCDALAAYDVDAPVAPTGLCADARFVFPR